MGYGVYEGFCHHGPDYDPNYDPAQKDDNKVCLMEPQTHHMSIIVCLQIQPSQNT